MSTLSDYLDFAKTRPALFVNPSSDGFTILLGEEEIREVETVMSLKLAARGLPSTWAQVGIVYEDQYGYILRDAVRFPGGALGTYIRFLSKSNDAVSTIVLPSYQGQILLVRRFRHATRTWHYEIPLGSEVKELTAEENARKELAELIGASASYLISLGQVEEGPGVAAGKAELFYAVVESYEGANLYKGISEILQVEVSEFERMMRESEITDSFTIIAYLYAKLQGLL